MGWTVVNALDEVLGDGGTLGRETKKPGVSAKQAFDENLTSYRHEQNGVPQLFWYDALLIASNGTESRVGSLRADWERSFAWKRVERENEPRRVSLEVMLRGVAEPGRLLDLVESFTVFSEHKTGYVKILAQSRAALGSRDGSSDDADLGAVAQRPQTAPVLKLVERSPLRWSPRSPRAIAPACGFGRIPVSASITSEALFICSSATSIRDRGRHHRKGQRPQKSICPDNLNKRAPIMLVGYSHSGP
jgi:hypothetical protein